MTVRWSLSTSCLRTEGFFIFYVLDTAANPLRQEMHYHCNVTNAYELYLPICNAIDLL